MTEGEVVDPVLDKGNIIETRDEILERLRTVLGWVSARDHNVAIDLDECVNKLENMASNSLITELAAVRAERDAARADLWRIYRIVQRPMVLLEEEFAKIRDAADLVMRDKDSSSSSAAIVSGTWTPPVTSVEVKVCDHE